MNIQWFPGHMAKTKRQILEILKKVDIVIEVVDARIPISSRNPMIEEIIGNKPHVLVLNKSDLADKYKTKEWITYFKNNGLPYTISLEAFKPRDIKTIIKTAEQCLKAANVTPKFNMTQAIIMGIPNCGKSTIINQMAKRKIAKVMDKPATTKHLKWINVTDTFSLCDTPGLLWPKFEDPEVGLKLALLGSIKSNIYNTENLINHSSDLLERLYPKRFTSIVETLSIESENEDDRTKAQLKALKDFQQGKLGKLTLDEVI